MRHWLYVLIADRRWRRAGGPYSTRQLAEYDAGNPDARIWRDFEAACQRAESRGESVANHLLYSKET